MEKAWRSMEKAWKRECSEKCVRGAIAG